MEKAAQMNFRCNPEVRAEAERVFGKWGISLADALNAFMVKSVEVGGLPFELRDDPYRPAAIAFDDPRVVVPKADENGFMEWGDDPFDEEGAVYDRFATR